MKDILFILGVGAIIYIVYRKALKLPLLPGKVKESEVADATLTKMKENRSKNSTKGNGNTGEEAVPFRQFFSNVKKIEKGVIHHQNHLYSMVAEVTPVNYYLLDDDEQLAIDSNYETWLAQLDNQNTRIYLQSRFIDLTEEIERIQQTMKEQEDLHPRAIEFGQYMIKDLLEWQKEQPRFETKRFIVFSITIDTKELKLEQGEKLQEKAAEKARKELMRQITTATQLLRKADIFVRPMNTSKIVEMLYYLFNRRGARKHRFKNIEEQEKLALYITAEQDVERIARVKEEIDDVLKTTKAKTNQKERTSA